MKKQILQPEQIIVPYEYKLGNESILKIYFNSFNKGNYNDLPPVLVAKPKHSDRNFILDHLADKENSDKYFRTIDSIDGMKNIFYLMDGNHRGVAATLCHKLISAIELENDDDLVELEEMIKEGRYFNIPNFPFNYFEDGDVKTKLSAAVTYLEEQQSTIKILTLQKRVDKLTSNGDIPQYMKERYLSLKNK